MSGNGTKIWRNGRTYRGEWSRGQRQGQGAQTWIDGSSYVGKWENDKTHGWGTQYFSNGNQAQGAVINGSFDGQGLHFRWGDGTTFKCKELLRCFDQNKLVRQNGTFIMLRRPPQQQRQAQRRQLQSRQPRTREFNQGWIVQDSVYFVNGDRFVSSAGGIIKSVPPFLSGPGTYYWRDGRKFQGQFVNGKKEGEGHFWGTDLSKYIGEFRQDSIEG